MADLCYVPFLANNIVLKSEHGKFNTAWANTLI